MTSAAVYQASMRIDAERGRLERLATLAASRTGQTALRHALAAVRIGADPSGAARDVLVGNPQIGQPGLQETIAQALVTSYLLGFRRTALAARVHAGHEVIGLSRAGDKLDEWYRRVAAVGALAESELTGLWQRARAAAGRMIQRMTAPLLRRVASVAGAASMPLPSKSAEVREVVTQFEKAGFVVDAPHGIAPEVAAGVVGAYEGGRGRGWREPEVRDRLWGFRYSAVLDDRTTRVCRGLDGTVLPKDDPFWAQWAPPNHYGCRSCVIEVWQSSKLREPTPVAGYERFGADFFIG